MLIVIEAIVELTEENYECKTNCIVIFIFSNTVN